MGLSELCSEERARKKAKKEHPSKKSDLDEALSVRTACLDVNVITNYENKAIRGDCLKLMRRLPSEILDCTITSPPYNKGGDVIVYNSISDNMPWDVYMAEQLAILNELYRITKPGGHLWYVHQVQPRPARLFHPMEWIIKSPWTVRQEIMWKKWGCQDRSLYRFKCFEERIYWLRKEPGPPFELKREVAKWGNLWVRPDQSVHLQRRYRHPSTFPLYLPLAILYAMNLPPGSLVFDPYGGTGTTAKAAQVSNHWYLTMDVDKDYITMTKDRLRDTVYEDEWWITVMMKQINDGTLNLSQDIRKSVQKRVLSSTYLADDAQSGDHR